VVIAEEVEHDRPWHPFGSPMSLGDRPWYCTPTRRGMSGEREIPGPRGRSGVGSLWCLDHLCTRGLVPRVRIPSLARRGNRTWFELGIDCARLKVNREGERGG